MNASDRTQTSESERAILAAWNKAVAAWRSDNRVSRMQSSLPGSDYDQSLWELMQVYLLATGSYSYCGPAMTAYGE